MHLIRPVDAFRQQDALPSGSPLGRQRRRGYTLIEVSLAVALLLLVVCFAAPNLIGQIEAQRLPKSCEQMRGLLTLVRANAMYDGKRYRVRFPGEDEIDGIGEDRQPLIEREDEPFLKPGVFNPVNDYWAYGETLLRDIWCNEVRLGRPTLDRIDDEKLVGEDVEERLEAEAEDFEEHYPPLTIETDGTSEWVTFVLTDAPRDVPEEEIENYSRIEVIMDGLTGLIWLQRPFYDEEVELFREHEWPPVLRRDFIRKAALTENDVLEIQETAVR